MGLFHVAKAVGFLNNDCKLVGIVIKLRLVVKGQSPLDTAIYEDVVVCRYMETYACGLWLSLPLSTGACMDLTF